LQDFLHQEDEDDNPKSIDNDNGPVTPIEQNR